MARVLVVEDSPTQQINMSRLLERHGHEVILADNGRSGVEMARSEQPDIILMDVVMPELNGFQATRKITQDETTRHIPVILVTTKDQETDKVWGQRQGAKGYITKPPREEDLIGMMNQLLSVSA